ncbi:MAG TPA: 1,4-dihydroxy-2-naphthoate octaprenyltransferase [bacterium]|nr:1,4-dihydroxy-2-naphthoate octaprenyltransferase [bacterium]
MTPIATTTKAWIAASRPHTLSAAAVPVAVGSALAASQGRFAWGLFALTLLGSLLVQIGTNLTDEFADHGATASEHKFLAPHKVIARGLLSERAVKVGTVVVFGAATVIGLSLVAQTGWPLLAVCVVSLACAVAYSAGPLPLGDLALGEPMVFLMMGPVMVMSTVYVQTRDWEGLALWYSLPVGALVTAILMANNLRDAEEDALHGRRTLVTVFGKRAVRGAHLALVVLAYAIPLVALLAGWATPWVLLPWLTLPLAVRVFRLLRAEGQRERLHNALKGTSGLHLSFGLLLAAALLLEGLLHG